MLNNNIWYRTKQEYDYITDSDMLCSITVLIVKL